MAQCPYRHQCQVVSLRVNTATRAIKCLYQRQTVGATAPPASLWMSPSWVLQRAHWRDMMPSSGTRISLRSGSMWNYVAQQGQVLALCLGWSTSLYEHSLGIGVSLAGKNLGLWWMKKKCQWGCKGGVGSKSDQTRKQPGQEALREHSGIVKQNHENTRWKSLTESRSYVWTSISTEDKMLEIHSWH